MILKYLSIIFTPILMTLQSANAAEVVVTKPVINATTDVDATVPAKEIEEAPEAILTEILPDSFIRPDADQIAIAQDRLARMTVPVDIEGTGPYKFIIDTASQRTILSTEIAGALTLELEDTVNIVALTGTTIVQTVYVPQLTLGRQSYDGLISPTFKTSNIGADGILGLDSLQGQRILFDFLAKKISVEDTRKPLKARTRNEIVVTARRRSGQLIFTNATISGIKTSVIIDTGGEVSIGNTALQRKLRMRSENLQKTDLVDITGKTIPAVYGLADELHIGRARFAKVPVAFADIAPFKALGLHKKPALFLGMDALRKFDRVAIDFANRKIYFLIPADA